MQTTIYCPDIECESCVHVLKKRLGHQEGVENIAIKEDRLIITHTEKVRKEDLKQIVKKAGFRADFNPFERKTFNERMRHFKENKHAYTVERQAIQKLGITFLALIVLEVIMYFSFLQGKEGFLAAYGLWFLYLAITVSTIGIAAWYFYSYRFKLTCMMGMMVGMTFGMQTGMMLGAILGATNGFFIGALVGLIVGTTIGFITGKGCGIMGAMEGMMAGAMGGTMGPMVTVMMFSDHLHVFMPFYMIINVAITLGLLYMVYEESIEGKEDVKKQKLDYAYFLAICVIITVATIALMVFGPKSPLIAF